MIFLHYNSKYENFRNEININFIIYCEYWFYCNIIMFKTLIH